MLATVKRSRSVELAGRKLRPLCRELASKLFTALPNAVCGSATNKILIYGVAAHNWAKLIAQDSLARYAQDM
jgi:hypothetical protein